MRGLSCYHKYSLGTDLRDGARRVLKLVVRANSRRDKAPVLLEVREELEQLKVVLRLGHDVKALPNFNAFEHAITQVVTIAKQNEGWLRSRSLHDAACDRERTAPGRPRRIGEGPLSMP